jgi:hypothetical protein
LAFLKRPKIACHDPKVLRRGSKKVKLLGRNCWIEDCNPHILAALTDGRCNGNWLAGVQLF